jgi:LysR family transcriptional regulator, regulator for bpeEF and oprC
MAYQSRPRLPTSAALLASLQTFFRVVEHQSFRAAARELGVTQPTVSRQVAALEAHLAVRLLQRTTRRVSPTPAGLVLFERGSAAMRSLLEVEDDVREAEAALTGVVRIATPGALGRRLVAPALRELLASYPGLSFELDVTDRLVGFVQGAVDFAVRVGAQKEASLAVRVAGTSTQLFVASRDYVRRHGAPKRMAALAEHTLITRGATGAMKTLWDDARRDGARVALASDDIETLHDAVQSDLGVGLLPRWMVADDVRRGTLVACVADAPDFGVPVCLVRAAASSLPRRARLAFDAVARSLSLALGAKVAGGRAPA